MAPGHAAVSATEQRTVQEAYVRKLQETYTGKTVARIHVDRNAMNGEHEMTIAFTDGTRLELATSETPGKEFACRLFINNTDYEYPF